MQVIDRDCQETTLPTTLETASCEGRCEPESIPLLPMTLEDALASVWDQVLVKAQTGVELDGKNYPVKKTRRKGLKTVQFRWGLYQIEGIEQNPETSSRWAALAREGKRVMQFSYQGRYIGNISEGELLRYPAWQGLGLPD